MDEIAEPIKKTRRECPLCHERAVIFTGRDWDQMVREFMCCSCNEDLEQDMNEDGDGDIYAISDSALYDTKL